MAYHLSQGRTEIDRILRRSRNDLITEVLVSGFTANVAESESQHMRRDMKAKGLISLTLRKSNNHKQGRIYNSAFALPYHNADMADFECEQRSTPKSSALFSLVEPLTLIEILNLYNCLGNALEIGDHRHKPHKAVLGGCSTFQYGTIR